MGVGLFHAEGRGSKSSLPPFRKVWASINSLFAKIWFTPPPPTPKKGPETRKKCTNLHKILKIDTFGGGGETRLCGQTDFMDKGISDPLKVCFPWILMEGGLACPGKFAGMSRANGDVQKVCAKI